MPASLQPSSPLSGGARGGPGSTAGDLLGMKWVTGFPGNRDLGLPSIAAVVILSDPATGRPLAILDGGPITAERTAAVSGTAIGRFGPHGPATVALIGAGVQGASHLEVIGHVLPGATVLVHDRHADRASRLADAARATSGIAAASVIGEALEATRAADVVITAVSFTDPASRQAMTSGWLRDDALVVPVDYATMCAAEVAAGASLFLVDDRAQFLANRDVGQFDGYPDPAMTFGEACLTDIRRPASGRVVATHLGAGLTDVIFADAIVRRAAAEGRGITLPAPAFDP